MAKGLAKILTLGALIIMSFGLFTGCGSAELKKGVYVTDDGFAKVTLSENNEFTFVRDFMCSYVPTGSYSIQKNKLTLYVDDSEKYVFDIKDAQLIFVRGNESVVKGTIFKLSEQ